MNEVLRIFKTIKQNFSSNTIRTSFFCTCIILNPDFGGVIGYGKSRLKYFFLQTPKSLDKNAILHDSAGSVKSTTKKRPRYCYLALVFPVHVFLVT